MREFLTINVRYIYNIKKIITIIIPLTSRFARFVVILVYYMYVHMYVQHIISYVIVLKNVEYLFHI